MPLVLRSDKGSALTYEEMDANFSGLANGAFSTANTDVIEVQTLSIVTTPWIKYPTAVEVSATLDANANYLTAGPLSIANTVTITVPTGTTWTIV